LRVLSLKGAGSGVVNVLWANGTQVKATCKLYCTDLARVLVTD